METEPPVIISSNNSPTPEATPGVRISSRIRVQIKQYYILSMLVKQYETSNTQVECKYILHPDAHMIFCQELNEEVSDASEVIMT